MSSNESKIYVEPPRSEGKDAEFFIQSNPANTPTCNVHIHNAVELLYIKEGSYRVYLDGVEHDLKKGDLILFCSNSIHCAYSQNEDVNQYYVIKILPYFLLDFADREFLSKYMIRFALNRESEKSVWKRDELENSEILCVLQDLIKEYGSPKYASEIAIRLKIMELLLAILRENADSQRLMTGNEHVAEQIYRIILYVRTHCTEDIDERKLAKDFGMSYSYFVRNFKSVMGVSFRKYLNIIRVRKAEQLLCTSESTVAEIALQCGYNSISYFISVYKSINGKTPYRHKVSSISRQMTE